ncbi:MAG: M1 family metallopeptidase [Chloroflexi bacterium]|nr:M1 family metallopeptidase [Chloroflexota bacterium]
MRPLRFLLFFAIFLVACATPAAPTPPPDPKLAIAVDDLAIFRHALLPSHQNDLALIDRPTRYELNLRYDAATPSLSGTQETLYTNRTTKPLNEIYFRLFANYPDSGGKIVVSNMTIGDALVTPTLQVSDTALRAPLANPLAPNAAARVRFEWTLTIPRNSKAHYSDFGLFDNVTTLPSAIPLIPAYDAAGWHIELPPAYGDLVYAEMALFDVTLTAPTAMTVIASGTTIDTRANNDGTTTWHLVGAPMRDFDINLTERLQKTSATVGETTIHSWHEPTDAESGKQALQFATDAFKVFTTRFGAYPYRELDVIETPTTAGGIEYPGVIVIARGLYRETRQRDFFEFATAHEISHQWWYALVGNDQVNAPWVDEALAQYSSLLYYEDLRGANAGPNIVKQVFQGPYERAKKEGRDAAVNQPVSAFNEQGYGEIVYGKAPLFYDAIRKKMGDDAFFKFLRTYFERFRYRVATPEDVIRMAEEVAGASLRAEYQQWILSGAK